MNTTGSIAQNHYLEAYTRFYAFKDFEFDQSHVEHILTNFLHLQDLINKNVQDLAYIMGNMLKEKQQTPNSRSTNETRSIDNQDKLCFKLLDTGNLNELMRKDKSKGYRYIRSNRYKQLKENSNGSKPKAFRLNSEDSRKSGDSKMRIESQDNNIRNSQHSQQYKQPCDEQKEREVTPSDPVDRFNDQQQNEPDYNSEIDPRISNFASFLRSSDKLIVKQLENTEINAEFFKETKKQFPEREPVRIIQRKKADRQQLNGYECFECKKVI